MWSRENSLYNHVELKARANSSRYFTTQSQKQSRFNRMLRLAPNPRTTLVKHKRHRRHHSTQTGHDSQSVWHTHVLVERRGNNDHSARSDVPNHGNRCERAGGIDLIRVDDVLVTEFRGGSGQYFLRRG
jgi:hypothetical protein